MKLVTVAQMRDIEKEADSNGLPCAKMMENAGRGLAEGCLQVENIKIGKQKTVLKDELSELIFLFLFYFRFFSLNNQLSPDLTMRILTPFPQKYNSFLYGPI
jgi:hypothetical protein